MWVDKKKGLCVETKLKVTLQAHFEANQFVMTKNFKSRLRPDAIPTIFVHRPVVKKRRAPAPRCTPRPVNIQHIAADHSYSVTVSKVEEKRDEDTQRRESDSEEREDMAREERQGQVTLPSQPAASQHTSEPSASQPLASQPSASQPSASQHTSEPSASHLAGPTGYKTLQEFQIPLPAIRTLQRRMEYIRFEPGVLTEVFDFLKLKVDGLADLERECVLSLDEMVITPSVELHMLTGKLYGDVTLPGHTGVATHACVFMLAGNTTRWKQVVAYHYSGNSTK
ncbi:unnamed protein product [Leuciscus chuanchicus]